ncbi:hypothetical protein NEMIN01_2476 [Nematocida minor]|uniref:uncharacterized protein n=1 Tax=Nematocida minor TaxID=1912983 RepID=UPI002220DC6A|nr:uncharacterized protein NEMIN01_2476 [Nematocida minor]KAI5193320.1 hypothetical protein NEMIN01_2476 [Nematocida minor]
MECEIPDTKLKIERMQGAKVSTVIDLKDGYFQIKLREEDRHKTAFRLMGRTCEFCSMPMGYMNAPVIFQKMRDEVLEDLREKNKAAVHGRDSSLHKDRRRAHGSSERSNEKTEEKQPEKNIKNTRVCRPEVKYSE